MIVLLPLLLQLPVLLWLLQAAMLVLQLPRGFLLPALTPVVALEAGALRAAVVAETEVQLVLPTLALPNLLLPSAAVQTAVQVVVVQVRHLLELPGALAAVPEEVVAELPPPVLPPLELAQVRALVAPVRGVPVQQMPVLQLLLPARLLLRPPHY